MTGTRKIIPGDIIYALGHSYPVVDILYQDYYGDRSNCSPSSDCWGNDIEFIDADGLYHHWKQNQDGGGILRVTRFAGNMGSNARIEQWLDVYQDEVKLLVFNSHGYKTWESHYSNGDYKSAIIDLQTRFDEYFI